MKKVQLTTGFLTPPQNEGQIVEVSYAWDDKGNLYRRVYDASDRTKEFYIGKRSQVDKIPEDWLPVNGRPEEWVDSWQKVDVEFDDSWL